MSEFHVEVVRIGKVGTHPNADRLEITHVHGGYPCIFRKGQFREGDLAVYVPVDAVVPRRAEFAFLWDMDDNRQSQRIKARRMRGLLSMGLLINAPCGATQGQDFTQTLGVVRYEPVDPSVKLGTGGAAEADPPFDFPRYTDIEGLRRWPAVLDVGEPVVITEKIHGTNARYVHDGERLWVGSRTRTLAYDERSIWWRAAEACGLADKLAECPRLVVYGEVYGRVQDLRYGLPNDVTFRLFDCWDPETGEWMEADMLEWTASALSLDHAPILYEGPWFQYLAKKCAEGKTTLPGADHVREGFVVRPVENRWHPKLGRVILKQAGEGYLLRNQK